MTIFQPNPPLPPVSLPSQPLPPQLRTAPATQAVHFRRHPPATLGHGTTQPGRRVRTAERHHHAPRLRTSRAAQPQRPHAPCAAMIDSLWPGRTSRRHQGTTRTVHPPLALTSAPMPPPPPVAASPPSQEQHTQCKTTGRPPSSPPCFTTPRPVPPAQVILQRAHQLAPGRPIRNRVPVKSSTPPAPHALPHVASSSPPSCGTQRGHARYLTRGAL